ncbi:MAG: amidohydrolase family protein [Spirochaetaceae bacterium]
MIIDIHSHIYPPSYLDLLARRSEIPRVETHGDGRHLVIFPDEARALGGTVAMTPAFWELEEKAAFMEAAGIDLSVISLGNPWLDFLPAEEAPEAARGVNTELDELAGGSEAFRALGVLPMQTPEAAAREVAFVGERRNLSGVILGTRAGNAPLDAPQVEPVWAALEDAGLPVFLHPHYGLGYDEMTGRGHTMPPALGFPFETTTAAVRLILDGLLDRHPKLQIILAHAGGTLPFLAGRLEKCVSVDAAARAELKRPFREYPPMLFYDAVTYAVEPLRALISQVGSDRVMFGTDHPFGIADPELSLSVIDAACEGEEKREALRSGNARRLL